MLTIRNSFWLNTACLLFLYSFKLIFLNMFFPPEKAFKWRADSQGSYKKSLAVVVLS